MSKRISVLVILIWAAVGALYGLEGTPVLKRMSFYEDNYFITGYGRGWTPIENFDDTNNQVKYQFSIKYLLDWDIGNWLKSDIFNLYMIYTQKHFWNLYDASAPFKEINFKPGLLFNINTGWSVLYKFDFIPILHESNGRDGTESHSWNRALVTLGLIDFWFLRMDVTLFHVYHFNLSEYNLDIRNYSGWAELFVRGSDNMDDPVFHADYRLKIASEGLTHTLDFKLAVFYLINPHWAKDVMAHLQLHYGYLESMETYNDITARIRLGVCFY